MDNPTICLSTDINFILNEITNTAPKDEQDESCPVNMSPSSRKRSSLSSESILLFKISKKFSHVINRYSQQIEEEEEEEGVIKEEETEENQEKEVYPANESKEKKGVDMTKEEEVKRLEMKKEQEAKKIITFLRKKIMQKNFKKSLKTIKYRRSIIQELLSTERSYIQNLSMLVIHFMGPVQRGEVTDSFSEMKSFLGVFANLEGIRALHMKMIGELERKIGRYHHLAQFAQIILHYIPFMRLYFTYCNDFETNSKLLDKFRAKNGCISLFLKKMENDSQLSDLLKHTSSLHPDLFAIQKCVDQFVELNLENNEKMNFLLKRSRLFQLQGLFEEIGEGGGRGIGEGTVGAGGGNGEEAEGGRISEGLGGRGRREEGGGENGKEAGKWRNLNFLESGREFLEEESLEVIVNNKPVCCQAWFLNDLIVVIQRNEILGLKQSPSLISLLFLSEDTLIKDLPNTKYLFEMFSIQTESGCLTFLAGNYDLKRKLVNIVAECVLALKEKNERKRRMLKGSNGFKNLIGGVCFSGERKSLVDLEVSVIGTEEQVDLIRTHTVYVIEVRIGEARQRIFFRFSEIYELYELIRKCYPKVLVAKLHRYSLFTYKKTKIIESRKQIIENFLTTVLKHHDVVNNAEKVLKFLGLPLNLFESGRREDEERRKREEEGRKREEEERRRINEEGSRREGEEREEARRRDDLEKRRMREEERRAVIRISSTNKENGMGIIRSPEKRGRPNRKSEQEMALTTSISKLLLSSQASFSSSSSLYRPSTLCSTASFLTTTSPSLFTPSSLPNPSSASLAPNSSSPSSSLHTRSPSLFTTPVRIFLPDKTSLNVVVDERTTAKDLCIEIQKIVGLLYVEDFRLLVKEGEEDRILDEDELILKRLFPNRYKCALQNTSNSLLSKLKQFIKMESLTFLSSNTLIFKKTIFLFDKLEKPDYLEDPIRLKYIAFQVIEDVLNAKFALNTNEYLSYVGLCCFLEFGRYKIEGTEDLICKDSKSHIGKSDLRREEFQMNGENDASNDKKYGVGSNYDDSATEKEKKMYQRKRKDNENEYKNRINHVLKRFYANDLLKKSEKNCFYAKRIWERISLGIMKITTTSEEYVGKEQNVCHFMILNLIKSRELYGVHLFSCQPYQIPFLPQNELYLGIRYDCLFILEKERMKVLRKYLLEELRNKVTYPKSIKFEVNEEKFRFNGKSCFGIMEMVEKYLELKEMLSGK